MSKKLKKTKDVDWYNKKYSTNTERFYCWNEKIFEIIQKSTVLNKEVKILEIGCGEGNLLKRIHNKIGIKKENLYGIEQSKIAIFKLNNEGFKNVKCADAKKIPFKDNFFDIVLMAEVIEHLRNPEATLTEIKRVLKNKGILILSFPNYLNVPWLFLRIAAECSMIADKMINLQPYDRIFTYFKIKKYLRKKGFEFKNSYGTNYFPPGLHLIEPMVFSDVMTKIGLTFLSFHPVLTFQHIKKYKSNLTNK